MIHDRTAGIELRMLARSSFPATKAVREQGACT